MVNIIDIEKIIDKSISKKTYTELCFEENTKTSMINSEKLNYCYDDISKDIKTSDTLIFNKNSIDFIEFKDINSKKLSKTDREFIRQLRLKVIESYITLYNFLNDNSHSITKDELSNFNLKYYFVFNKNQFSGKPTLLNTFKANQEKWTKHYNRFFTVINFIDHETFIKKYNI